jgi:hypothetical protein
MLGHSKLDILKMDIEGLEFEVLDSILTSSIEIDQLCIEFHDRFFPDTPSRTPHAIKQLSRAGFELFAVSDSLEEFSFVHRRVLPQLQTSRLVA